MHTLEVHLLIQPGLKGRLSLALMLNNVNQKAISGTNWETCFKSALGVQIKTLIMHPEFSSE